MELQEMIITAGKWDTFKVAFTIVSKISLNVQYSLK